MSGHLPECAAAVARPGTFTSCICDELKACEARVAHEERARIVAGISAWCVDDPVISGADPNNVWDYAEGVRFTRLRIERGDFND